MTLNIKHNPMAAKKKSSKKKYPSKTSKKRDIPTVEADEIVEEGGIESASIPSQLTDTELDKVKKILPSFVYSAITFAVIYFGVGYWKASRAQQNSIASDYYDSMRRGYISSDSKEISKTYNEMRGLLSKTSTSYKNIAETYGIYGLIKDKKYSELKGALKKVAPSTEELGEDFFSETLNKNFLNELNVFVVGKGLLRDTENEENYKAGYAALKDLVENGTFFSSVSAEELKSWLDNANLNNDYRKKVKEEYEMSVSILKTRQPWHQL